MRRKINIFLVFIMLIMLVSCSNTEDTGSSGGVCFEDDTGRSVTVNEPKKVAVLFSSFAEIWTLAGGEVSITVGETVERGFADADALLVDNGAGKSIAQELLLSYEPDFVIYSCDIAAQAETAALLAAAKIPAAGFRVETFDDYLRVLKIFTEITGNETAYETYGEKVRMEIESIFAALPMQAEKQKILFIRAGSGSRSTKAKTAEEHFACVMLNELGTYNIAENAKVLLDGLSVEEVLIENPQYIFISAMGDEAAAKAYMESVLAEDAWQSLDAIQSDRVYYLPKELFQFKPNGRWAEAYRYLAEILYETQS